MKKIIALLLVFTLVLAAAGCTPSTTSSSAPASSSAATSSAATSSAATSSEAPKSKYDEGDTIHIGCVTELTGARAQNGLYTSEAVELWVEEVNAAGGILGRKVEVHIEDDQSSDQTTANAYQKLMARGDISACLLPLYSSMALAAEPYVLQYKVPSITGGSSVKFATLDDDYIWQIRYNDTLAGSTMANFAVNTLKCTKPAIMNETDSFGMGLGDAAVAKLKELGIEPVLRITYNSGEANFDGYIAQIKASGCDSLLCVSQQTEAALIMMAAKAGGLSVPCIGSTSYCSEQAMKAAGEPANGWYSVSDWSPTVTEKTGADWVTRYNEKFDHVPDLPSSTMWDALVVIKAAIEAGGSADPASINEQIPLLKDLQGVASVYTPNENRICATSQFVTQNVEFKAVIKDTIYR